MTVRAPYAKRWLKKWARRCVAAGGWATHPARHKCEDGLRILTYHRIEADASDPFSVAPSSFHEQMVILSSTGAVAPLQKALDQLEGGNTRTPRIAISFDDGTRDFLSEALPVLQKFHLPATLYVSPLRVGQKGFLNWKELVEISQSNVNIESHGLDHRSLAGLTAEELHRQLGESKRLLEQHLDKEVTSIAYPYGTVKDFDEGVKEAVRKAGYRSGCSSVNGINKTDSDRYELRRTKIEQADLPIFTWILAGYLDVWSIVDRRLGNLQNRYL